VRASYLLEHPLASPCLVLGQVRNDPSVQSACASHQLQRLQTRVSVLADDEMVVHGNAERPRDLDNRPRHVDVGARGRRIAGRMVVHHSSYFG